MILPGAYGAFNPTPKSIAYGIAKAAVHHLVKSLGEGTGLPESSIVIGLMPLVIDTPANRKMMPKADVTNWTSPFEISEKILEWIQGKSLPKSGSLVKIETIKGNTSYEYQ